MKKELTAFAFCLAFALSQRGMAADTGWYSVLDVGQSSFQDLENRGEAFADNNGWRIHNEGDSIRLAAAYRFNPYLGIEAGYAHLGEATETFYGSSLTDVHTVKTRGFTVEAVGTLPLSISWSLFGRAGVFRGQTSSFTGQPQANSWSADDTHLEMTYGLGAAWAINERVTLRLNWDRYTVRVRTDPLFSYDNSCRIVVTAIGVVYAF